MLMPRANTLFFRSPWSLVFCSSNTPRLECQLLRAPFEFFLNVFFSLQCGLLFRGPVCYVHFFFSLSGSNRGAKSSSLRAETGSSLSLVEVLRSTVYRSQPTAENVGSKSFSGLDEAGTRALHACRAVKS